MTTTSTPAAKRSTASTHATVLVVDDDEFVRNLLKIVLEHAGYKVLTAACGAELPGLLGKYGDTIDLLLSDVDMPLLSGPEVSAQIVGVGWTTRVLFMSGHSAEALIQRGLLKPGMRFLAKPLTPDALVKAVRETLNARP